MQLSKMKWGPWFQPTGSVIKDIRFTHNGRWIEKRYYEVSTAQSTYENQDEADELECMPGTQEESYISRACRMIDDTVAGVLFDRISLQNHQELVELYEDTDDGLLDFINCARAEWQFNEVLGKFPVKDFTEIFRVSHNSSGMDFGDNHWENVGFHPDDTTQFVCTDYDGFNYCY